MGSPTRSLKTSRQLLLSPLTRWCPLRNSTVDISNLTLLDRTELGITFTKIRCWTLTQYNKCVFLDADTLVLTNSDELFDREEFSAAPDAGWPDCFNSGVFVFRPNLNTFRDLVKHAMTQGSFDGGDQGLLNTFFSSWATKDISKHIPFVYNMVATAPYSSLPASNTLVGASRSSTSSEPPNRSSSVST